LIRGDPDERLLSAAALSGHDWEWSTLPVLEISPKTLRRFTDATANGLPNKGVVV
jgi:hypothetical protein